MSSPFRNKYNSTTPLKNQHHQHRCREGCLRHRLGPHLQRSLRDSSMCPDGTAGRAESGVSKCRAIRWAGLQNSDSFLMFVGVLSLAPAPVSLLPLPVRAAHCGFQAHLAPWHPPAPAPTPQRQPFPGDPAHRCRIRVWALGSGQPEPTGRVSCLAPGC